MNLNINNKDYDLSKMRCRCIRRCRLVSRCRLVFLSISGILNISNVSIVSINSVGHSLGTAVREENVVRAGGGLSVPVFASAKVDSRVVILNFVSVVVVGGFAVLGFVVRGSWFVGRGGLVGWGGPVGIVSDGNSHDSEKSNEDLHVVGLVVMIQMMLKTKSSTSFILLVTTMVFNPENGRTLTLARKISRKIGPPFFLTYL